ncbi:MAG TPA: hypothetical protein VF655_00095 [Allosphingosinicella sp.]|jgi:hypothetical protein
MNTPSHELSAADAAAEGMARAAANADAKQEQWTARAFAYLTSYAETHFEFMTEDVRVAAYAEGLPVPSDGRAWGSVTQRAARENYIAVSAYRKTRIRPAHATPRPLWRSLVFKEQAA